MKLDQSQARDMKRKGRSAPAKSAAGVMLLLFTTLACDSPARYQFLKTFVDGMPPYQEWLHPKPEKRTPVVQIRRQTPEATAQVAEPPKPKPFFTGKRPDIEKLASWAEVEARLPKNKVEGPDWGAALSQGIIAPLTSLTPGETGIEELPIEVNLKGAMPVVFPHAPHTRWLACDNCHTDIFPMEGGATEMTMEDLNDGKFCGVCHGKVAFDIMTGCPLCHPEMGS